MKPSIFFVYAFSTLTVLIGIGANFMTLRGSSTSYILALGLIQL